MSFSLLRSKTLESLNTSSLLFYFHSFLSYSFRGHRQGAFQSSKLFLQPSFLQVQFFDNIISCGKLNFKVTVHLRLTFQFLFSLFSERDLFGQLLSSMLHLRLQFMYQGILLLNKIQQSSAIIFVFTKDPPDFSF
ncbi:hypothetical protein M758_1G127500 [Ceratodon purpureus]|nr:hypothetical protein M758_1G127500 [Ceratodon purpureus]